MPNTPDPVAIHRDSVVFISPSRGIGGPAQSLLTVLEHLSDDLDRVLGVSQAYARCDIVLSPSRTESSGRVAAEAMTTGLPVSPSDLPAHGQLTGDAGGGVPFPSVGLAAAAARR